jgi:predicted deacylase
LKTRTIEINDMPSFFHEIYEFGSEEKFPEVVITAGIHGDEVTGIYVAERLIKYFIENEPRNGHIKIIPMCNPTATRQIKRCSFYDGLDMNRIFPGSPDGSTTMRAADNIWRESENADIIIDLHCCSQSSMTYALAIYDEFPEVERLVKGLNIPNLVLSEGVGGQLFTESCRKRGQKSFIIELPSGICPGAVNFQAAEECFQAVLNMMVFEGFIVGSYVDNPPKSYGRIKDVLSNVNGLWFPYVKNSQLINKGDILGNVSGIDVHAPENGKVLITVPGSYVFAGDNILSYVQDK